VRAEEVVVGVVPIVAEVGSEEELNEAGAPLPDRAAGVAAGIRS